MAKTKTSSAVKMKYNNRVYDKITVQTRKDDLPKTLIAEAAEAEGMKMNAFILEAIKEKMKIK